MTAPDPSWRPRQPVGLLDHLTATSLDEDYAHVAARRRAAASGPPGSGSSSTSRPRGASLLAILAAFGLLLTTAAVQTARGAPTQERSRESLVQQVRERRDELGEAREELRELRRGLARAAQTRTAGREQVDALDQRVRRLGSATGEAGVTGPGVRITVDDRPDARTQRQVVLDEDLQRLVNGLWVAGAEAIAINNERLTGLSAVRGAGEAITVNFRSLRRPYVVEAIGDPDALPARFIESEGGTWWLNLESVYQLRFDMSSEESLTLPAVPPLSLRHAQVGERAVNR
jgi:uncharacterized protein YlxW (UPF0749 family)